MLKLNLETALKESAANHGVEVAALKLPVTLTKVRAAAIKKAETKLKSHRANATKVIGLVAKNEDWPDSAQGAATDLAYNLKSMDSWIEGIKTVPKNILKSESKALVRIIGQMITLGKRISKAATAQGKKSTTRLPTQSGAVIRIMVKDLSQLRAAIMPLTK